ncbi:hypothetical protein BDA96_01G214300 [Sorghum bicolor]|jgi:hypothetical protein|uniref:Uncharacterized protein n=2 Tax=Sorghum bicolor TaxID=4558 RepID=A0A921S084_SORBI|nr:uncharacterized protein LOC110432049 [Sorghum bicolor]KAG0548974.1 hypothetical protein BDA96_01G214300 [Sorghum bicolor]KXG38218.1 hypothetical protein SORBI_3001G201200 [Sorghum bicolor]|eukprot:XP_021307698.1 uncharacterized protein LOC110432049 [Sorghum bicolor]
MDVYISEEYVAQRRAERRAARVAAAAARCGGEEKARADSEQKRWTADKGKRRPADGGGNAADTNVGGSGAASWLVGEDAVLSYFSA